MASSDSEYGIPQVLAWIREARRLTGVAGTKALRRQIEALRNSPISDEQRCKLLDLLFLHCERLVTAHREKLADVQLPVPRALKISVRETQAILENIAQDYLNTLAALFDPHGASKPPPLVDTLGRAACAMTWSMEIGYLAAAPENPGLWQQWHQLYGNACRLTVQHVPTVTLGGQTLHQAYSQALLAAIAQPAAFTAQELSLIDAYLHEHAPGLEFAATAPSTATALFWIDPLKDFPATAAVRRRPADDVVVRYFSAAPAAARLQTHIAALQSGTSPETLKLPPDAASPSSLATLQRLQKLWSSPAKRRFSRRRQSYRIALCAGIESLRQLARSPQRAVQSEWMVTNESPDGLAAMHVAGPEVGLRIGDIVAVKALGDRAEKQPDWLIALVRWALSENPEHIEIGLELIAPRAIAGELVPPTGQSDDRIPVLVLPKAPPLRQHDALVTSTGQLQPDQQRLVLVMEKENLEICEIRPGSLDEQTNSVDLLSFATDESD